MSRPLAPIPSGVGPRLAPITDIDTVAFDVYGTLLCSGAGEVGLLDSGGAGAGFEAAAAAIGDAPERVSARFFAALRTRQDAMRSRDNRWPDPDVREVWRAVLGGAGVDSTAGGGAAAPAVPAAAAAAATPTAPTDDEIEAIALTVECARNPSWPMPGARAVIEAVAGAGFRVAIVSNAQFYTPIVLQTLLGASIGELGVDRAWWSYETGAAKPGGTMFAALRAEGGNVVYIGNDMRNDVAAASRAGMKTVLFAGDRRSLRLREGDDAVVGVEPDAVITELSQLLIVLGHPRSIANPASERVRGVHPA